MNIIEACEEGDIERVKERMKERKKMRERNNTTQHNMRQDTSRRDKTRQDKSRQDKTRQARQNKPSHPFPQDYLAKSKTNYTSAHSPLFLFKLFTNAHVHVFHL